MISEIKRKNFKDLTGIRFGRLLVLERDQDRLLTRKQFYWKVKCDCGTVKVVRGCSLKSHTRSCGCIQKEAARKNGKNTKKDHNITLSKDIFTNYKRRARVKNFSWELSLDEFRKFIKLDCFYCQKEPSNKICRPRSKDRCIVYNGIDRIDSKLGYTKNNIVACCAQCNTSKNDYTLDEFKDWIRRVYKNYVNI